METLVRQDNKSFSWERFKALMKADLAVNKSNYLKLFIGGTGVFVAIALLIGIIAIIDINSLRQASELTGRVFEEAIKSKQESYGAGYLGISIWIFGLGITILGSLTFSNLSSKRKRISAFMIPASQAEKFLLRVLIYLVAGSLSLLIGLIIGLGISQIAYGGAFLALENVIKFLHEDLAGSIIVALFLMVLLSNSLYSLGSSLWPKLSWIKTWVVMMVLEWVGAIVMIIVSTADISWYSFFMYWDNHITLLKWVGISLLTVLNIACWVLAWIRYHNTQIIQRFMTK